jgi:hypothetical protein
MRGNQGVIETDLVLSSCAFKLHTFAMRAKLLTLPVLGVECCFCLVTERVEVLPDLLDNAA